MKPIPLAGLAEFTAVLLAFATLCALGGCTGGADAETDAERAAAGFLGVSQELLELYPDSRYLAAPGYSAVSAADAGTNARAAVADAIRSRLRSSLEAQTRELQRNDVLVRETEYRRTISTDAEFAYGEMIKVDATVTRHAADQYVAIAYLDRIRAAEVLSRDYEEAATGFRAATTELPSLTRDMAAYAETVRTARASYRRLADRDRELRAISGHGHGEFQDDFRRYREALAQQRQVLAGISVGLVVADAEGFPGARVAAQVAEALNHLGLTVVGRGCDHARYVLHLEPSLRERRIIGSVFELSFDGVLSHCDGGHEAAVVHLSHPDFRGEGRSPLQQLQLRITADRLAELLLESLGHALPLWLDR